MVRFINQNFAMNFNFQSENKNLGTGGIDNGGGGGSDYIDQELATKAVQAVNYQRMHQDNYQSESNDSSTYSESESLESEASEGEHSVEGKLIIDEADKPIIQLEKDIKRKERRRERNKLSAQNYRRRRRVQTSVQEQTLQDLEKHHKELLFKVNRLEEEKRFVEEFLKKHVKIPWPSHCYPNPCPATMCCYSTTKCCHPTTGTITTTMPTVTMETPMTMDTAVEVTS